MGGRKAKVIDDHVLPELLAFNAPDVAFKMDLELDVLEEGLLAVGKAYLDWLQIEDDEAESGFRPDVSERLLPSVDSGQILVLRASLLSGAKDRGVLRCRPEQVGERDRGITAHLDGLGLKFGWPEVRRHRQDQAPAHCTDVVFERAPAVHCCPHGVAYDQSIEVNGGCA